MAGVGLSSGRRSAREIFPLTRHTGLAGATPAERSGVPAQPIARLESYSWRQHCNGLFHPSGCLNCNSTQTGFGLVVDSL